MGIFRKGSLSVAGRVIGFAATYALLLNLVLTGLLGSQNVMAAGHGEAGFELCLSSPDGAQPSTNGASHAAKVHCVLCTVGSAVATGPEPSMAVTVAFVASRIAPKPVFADVPASSVHHHSASPRGPPQQA